MIGFGVGGVLMGRLADRFGIIVPAARSARVALGRRLSSLPAYAASLWQFALVHGLLIGTFGSSATFAPLIADISHWFVRRRGIAVAICAAATTSPARSGRRSCSTSSRPSAGARPTSASASFCVADDAAARASCCGVAPPRSAAARPGAAAGERRRRRPLGLSPGRAAGAAGRRRRACCVAMSMPQVHIVAYCGDLGYGVGARRRDAVADAGLRHRQPHRLGLHRRPHRRPAHAAARLGRCRASRCCSILPFDGLTSLYVDLGAVRPVPGRHRAELRHHRARVLPAARSRRARRHRASWRRCSAWRSAAGCRA